MIIISFSDFSLDLFLIPCRVPDFSRFFQVVSDPVEQLSRLRDWLTRSECPVDGLRRRQIRGDVQLRRL